MYGQGQQLYGSQASIYGGGLPVPGRDPAADAPGLPSATLPLLRDINSYAQVRAPGISRLELRCGSGRAPCARISPAVAELRGTATLWRAALRVQPAGGLQCRAVLRPAGPTRAKQQAYQTAAATASSGYGTAYPPQAASTYGAPPGYGAPYGQQAATYPANPTAYATAGYGLGQSPYNYLQQPAGAGGASGAFEQAPTGSEALKNSSLEGR
ncbi:unnamed protein product [Durusdinium trenchii]|uniref:Uncharacterized protein n=1 Tax=Durusdinium trenchii TaxID=1381693 RepID=A0ABP0NUT9_9DINO